jgi:hypothetical protein
MPFYAGIGSRKAPPNVLTAMTAIAQQLHEMGYTLRSGGAKGSDKAFEAGTENKEIFQAADCTPEAIAIARQYHPAWHVLNEYARNLHGRNAMQILGRNLDSPVEFVVCWTPDGCTSHATRSIETGGTGTAISIASERGIPVYNLKNKEDVEKIRTMLD